MKENFEKMLQLLVEHGGDCGGAYFSYPEGLEESVEVIKNALGLSDYEVNWRKKYDNHNYIFSTYPYLTKK